MRSNHLRMRPAGLAFLWGVISVSVFSGCGERDGSGDAAAESPATPVAAVEAARRDLSRQLATSATVEPRTRIRLASRTSGTLREVNFEEGDAVERGTLLAQLETAEEEAELRRAQAVEAQAREHYRRMSELRQTDRVSLSEYEEARMEVSIAESDRILWETRVAFGQITAPRDAVVTARHVEPGEAVATEDTLFELATLDELVVRLGVSELDVVHLQPGQRMPLHLDALPELGMEGTIRRIFPQADISSRLVTVEVALPAGAADRGVRPGYLARVRMPIDARSDVIAVPSAAIGEAAGSSYVFVIVDELLEQRPVERGVSRGQWTEIISGVDEGEVVLASNPNDRSEGERVRIVGWRG